MERVTEPLTICTLELDEVKGPPNTLKPSNEGALKCLPSKLASNTTWKRSPTMTCRLVDTVSVGSSSCAQSDMGATHINTNNQNILFIDLLFSRCKNMYLSICPLGRTHAVRPYQSLSDFFLGCCLTFCSLTFSMVCFSWFSRASNMRWASSFDIS